MYVTNSLNLTPRDSIFYFVWGIRERKLLRCNVRQLNFLFYALKFLFHDNLP